MTKAESWASSAAAQAVMQANRGRDTKPELALRKALYSLGMRYRVNHRSPVNPRSTIDVAFPRQRVAVFVDGCFWHGCPVHHRPASTNADYWSGKLTANRARDLDATAKLEAAGWKVLRVWEHDDPEVASMTVEAMVRGSEDGARFTLDALEAGAVESGVAVASWPALHFGPSWNGWATPVVTRAVLADILHHGSWGDGRAASVGRCGRGHLRATRRVRR